jgi:acyl-CoA dehydrogenase
METETMTELEVFRKETRLWLEENCPKGMRQPIIDLNSLYWGGKQSEFESEDQKIWFERMLEKKWIVPYWPEKYGGGGLSLKENKIIEEEMTSLGCRRPLFSFGITMLGPALLEFATEAQKVKYLNEIVKGEIRWCQGYSEPNAGSDLAGLQTKAEDKGDHYLVNGTKVWTSYGDKADWIFALVRTDFEVKKQRGISFLLIDMTNGGVSTRPIKLISGKSPFTETFFDNAKVPKENLVGELNKGWTIAKYLLTHERQMIGSMADGKRKLSTIAIEQVGLNNGILADTVLRTEVARNEMNDRIFDLTVTRAVDEAKAGHNSGAVSSMFKYYGTEINIQREEINMALRGSDGLEWESDASNNGFEPRMFLRSKGNSIEGGTHEVQLNIIAKQILGLPS